MRLGGGQLMRETATHFYTAVLMDLTYLRPVLIQDNPEGLILFMLIENYQFRFLEWSFSITTDGGGITRDGGDVRHI